MNMKESRVRRKRRALDFFVRSDDSELIIK